MQAAPGADTNNRPPNKPPMEQPKRPAAALGAQIALEALPTPPAPQRVPTKAPATRPATTATRANATVARPAGDIQGSMESAGAQQAQRSAASAGFASALPWGAVSTAAVAAGYKFSPGFAKATSPSARVALAISPPLFAFFLAGDLRVHHDAKNRGDVATARSSSTWPLRLANAFYNHTLIAFGMVITPMLGRGVLLIWTAALVVDAAPHAGTARYYIPSSRSRATRAGGYLTR